MPAQNASGGTWVGPRSFEALHDVPNWRDFGPRVGVVYDLFGNGKTVIKATLSRYVQLNAIGYARGANPFNASFSSATRSWNDVNGDLVPQADELGPLSNANFGTPGTDVRGNVINDEFDDNLREGWGVRRNNWEISAGIQHELLPRVSVEVLYTRRAQGNFQATDNLLVTPDDYDPYCVTAPTDPRLPGGGGFEICGLYDITPEKFGLSKRYTTHADNLGGRSQVYDGVDVTMNARMDNGLFVSGGMSSGHTSTDNCAVIDSPEKRFCRVSPAWLTQVQALRGVPAAVGHDGQRGVSERPGARNSRGRALHRRGHRSLAGPYPRGRTPPQGR